MHSRHGVRKLAVRALVLGLAFGAVTCSTEPTRQFTVTVIPTPHEGGSATGGGRFAPGSTVTLTAQPNPPYIFGGWRRDDQAIASLAATYTFVDSIDHKFEALFLAPFRAEFLFPRPYDPIPDTLYLVVHTVSPRAVASVRADVAGTKVDLTRPRDTGSWTANVDISRLPLDTVRVTVVVTDVAGDTATSRINVFHDPLPTVDVVGIADQSVARPRLAYSASCTDNLPGCTLTLVANTTTLATGMGKIAGTLSLEASDGRPVSVGVIARDSRFQTNSIFRTIYVEASPQLDSIGSVPAPFIDVDATRALFRLADSISVTLREWSTGVDTRIPVTLPLLSARLTPYGAAITSLANGQWRWTDWRNGVGSNHSGGALTVVGQYALITRPKGNSSTDSVFWYDLATRSEVFVTENYCCASGTRLSANGDVIIAGTAAALRRYGDGNISPLPGEPASVLGDSLPLVSGMTVVYRKTSPGFSSSTTYQLAMNDGSGEVLLGPQRFRSSVPNSTILPGQDYDVNNGWVAFTQSDELRRREVWLRGPTGNMRQISPSGSDALLSALGPDGTVLFTVGTRRFLCPQGGTPRDVGGSHGTVQWFNGQPYLILGHAFFRIR